MNAARRAAFSLARQAAALVVAAAGAGLCLALGTPLPWLIGPLVAVAAASMAGIGLESPLAARDVGQWAIGVALGLYFSPAVVREVVRLAPWIALAIGSTIVLGWLGAWLLMRMTSTEATTAYFAMSIGGASEMATQCERHGGRVDRVAAAHSLRLVLVVLVVPLVFNALHLRGLDPYTPVATVFSWSGFAVLLAVTAASAAVMQRLDVPNAWMIGPLLAAALITGSGHAFSALPAIVFNIGQMLIGIALGTRFTPEFFRAAPRFLAVVAAITTLYMVLAAGVGILLGVGSGLQWATAVLATTPGGIGEMALTARALDLGVPIVTAFHALRLAVIVLTIGPTFRLWRRRRQRT